MKDTSKPLTNFIHDWEKSSKQIRKIEHRAKKQTQSVQNAVREAFKKIKGQILGSPFCQKLKALPFAFIEGFVFGYFADEDQLYLKVIIQHDITKAQFHEFYDSIESSLGSIMQEISDHFIGCNYSCGKAEDELTEYNVWIPKN
jgi:hypothetical protein